MSYRDKKKKNKLKDPDYKLAEEQFEELNKQYYDSFLINFYSVKVRNLLSLITNTEKFTSDFIKKPIEIDLLKIDAMEEDFEADKIIKYAKAELAMSYFHCLETFIRMFIAHAKFTGCPWLELARLSISKYKDELQKISEGKFNHLNNILSENETILYVFTGFNKPTGEITEEFIDGYKKWLSFAASQLLETYDYNSFKHGLAISPTQNGFRLGPEDDVKLEAHGEVIEHLTRMSSGDRVIWARQTNFVKYDQKATFLLVLEGLMTNILDVGRETYLQERKEDRIIFKPQVFLPEKILNSDNEQKIKVDSFRRGLLYYK
jgi:hypothetical protein